MRKVGMLSLFLLILGSCVNLYADQIVLKNGDRLSGTVVKSDAKTLLIKTEFEGDVTVQWAAIDTIASTQPLHVGLKGGQMIVGPVTTSDGALHIASQPAGVVTAPKDAVEVLRSDAEQAAYDAEIERLRHPHLLDFWAGFFDTGLSLTSGNPRRPSTTPCPARPSAPPTATKSQSTQPHFTAGTITPLPAKPSPTKFAAASGAT